MFGRLQGLARVPCLWGRWPTCQLYLWRFPRFSPTTEFYSSCRANRGHSSSARRPAPPRSWSHRFLKKLLGERCKGFLALFLGGKKGAPLGPHSGSELSADFIQFIHAVGSFRQVLGRLVRRHLDAVALWTLALALLGPRSLLGRSDVGYGARHVVRLLHHGPRGKRGAGECVFFLVYSLTQTIMAALVKLGRALVMREPADALCKFPTCCSHLESGS